MKKFRYYFALITLVCILASSLLFAACKETPSKPDNNKNTNQQTNSGNVNPVEYNCAFQHHYSKDSNPYITSYFDNNDKNVTELISTKQALDSFCSEKSLPIDYTRNSYYNYRLSDKIKDYDDAFFEDVALFIYFSFEESEDVYKFSDFQISDELININLAKTNGEYTTLPRTSAYVFEINKKYLKEDTQIKINETNNYDYNVKIYRFGSLTVKNNCPTSFKIDSKAALNEFCNVETSPFFNEYKEIEELFPFLSNEDINDEKFREILLKELKVANERNKEIIQLLNTYDDNFFQNKSLIIHIRISIDNRFYSFKEFEIQDDDLNITLSTPNLNGDYSIEGFTESCLYILEIDKEKVTNITQINVKEIEE